MAQVEKHSSVVGGSTASRVINCPGSVQLSNQMPAKPSSSYADEGTLLHDVISDILTTGKKPESFLGRKFNQAVLTQELIDEKLTPALDALDEIDPDEIMDLEVEQDVSFGDFIPDAFGSVDVVGRIGNRAIVLDWKFGSGVAVSAEDNKQLMFYAAAARRTETTKWAFKGAKDLELIIVQPPETKRWVTTFDEIDQFELELAHAVKKSQQPDAPLDLGDHCRWCAAKSICPLMNGAADRMLQSKLQDLSAYDLGDLLEKAKQVEGWIADLRGLAVQMLENDQPVEGWKLVQKRAIRKWTDDKEAVKALKEAGLAEENVYKPYEVISPAQAEKILKKLKQPLPEDLIKAVSSGTTLAPETDSRPAVLNVGRQLTAALNKIQ